MMPLGKPSSPTRSAKRGEYGKISKCHASRQLERGSSKRREKDFDDDNNDDNEEDNDDDDDDDDDDGIMVLLMTTICGPNK